MSTSPFVCVKKFFGAILLTLLSISSTTFAAKLQITPTTTLTAETGNNTSAADSVGTLTRGYAATGNMSKLPIRSLVYPGANTKIYAALMGWFGMSSHIPVGYKSNDPIQVQKQVEDMQSRGIEGAILAWYGAGSNMENLTAPLLRQQAEAHPGFTFAIMVDQGTIQWNSMGLSPTDALIYHLNYVAQNYYPSPAYMRMNGRPVVFEFGLEAWPIDWARVVSSVQGNPTFIFRNPGGFTHLFTSGAYSWGPAGGLSYTDYFLKIAALNATVPVYGDGSKGFNDVLASWSANRVVDQQCGQTWLNTLAETGKFYSSTKQLPYLQVATWNDYEEGTSIESGIDNCLSVNATVSGAMLQWSLQGAGLENTLDHYSIFISTDGQNLMPLGDVPTGTYQYDLSSLVLSPGTYTLYVKAVAKASLKNQMSGAVSYSIANQPPTAVLAVSPSSGIAPVSVSASTAGSSDVDGTIAASQIDFGDGVVATGAAATHVYSVPGSYTVTAKVTDDMGASSFATSIINVVANQPPKAVLSLTPSSGVAPVSVSASTGGSSDVDGSIAGSQIDFSDGTVVVGSAATHLYKVAGTYAVAAKVTDNQGASTITTKMVTVAAPSVTISSPVNGASVNSPVRVTASALSGLPITGMWVYVDNVGVYSVHAESLNTTLNISPGKHTVMVKAWDSNGNISVSSVTITVLSGTSLIRPARASRDSTTIPALTAQAGTAATDSSQTVTVSRGQRAQRLQAATVPQ
ncbi:MAG: hypothetical protein JWO20_2470 [Candidatus Angelobacter sp.]|nr:hypothetical protein [Candidatus Angelobacter sp.]